MCSKTSFVTKKNNEVLKSLYKAPCPNTLNDFLKFINRDVFIFNMIHSRPIKTAITLEMRWVWERGCRCVRVCASAAVAPAGRGVQRRAGPAAGRRRRRRLRRTSATRRATTTSRLDQLIHAELREHCFVGRRLAELHKLLNVCTEVTN